MENEQDSFKDFAFRGLDAFLKLTSKAGDSLRTASDKAIEQLDSLQLEKKLSILYTRLGKTSYIILESGEPVLLQDPQISPLLEDIALITAEQDRRKESRKFSE